MGEIKTNSQLLWQLECQKYTSQFNHTDKDSKPPSLSVEEVHCVATSIIHSNNNNNLSDTNCLHSILNRENQVNCQWKWIQMDVVVPWNFMGKKWFKINWFLFFVVTMSMFFYWDMRSFWDSKIIPYPVFVAVSVEQKLTKIHKK